MFERPIQVLFIFLKTYFLYWYMAFEYLIYFLFVRKSKDVAIHFGFPENMTRCKIYNFEFVETIFVAEWSVRGQHVKRCSFDETPGSRVAPATQRLRPKVSRPDPILMLLNHT